MATKEHKKQARGLIEGLESRVHLGPPIRDTEISSVRDFLRESDFSPSSDYFSRLMQIQCRLESRVGAPESAPTKRNYGGEAAGYWMQVQSAYDHVILSICYEGEFHFQRGRVKISHRFNQAGRIDFVELKFLRSLNPSLDGALRKLLTVKDYGTLRKDWREAEAFVLEVLPRELIFLYQDLFRCERNEVFAWLINIGHRLIQDLVDQLKAGTVNGMMPRSDSVSNQLCLSAVRTDEIAFPILAKAAELEALVEILEPKQVVVRYKGME